MPSKNMRHLFEFCCLLLLATVTAGILSAILIPCKISYPDHDKPAVSQTK